MVCWVEASQLLLMLPHRPDLEAEKTVDMPYTEHACSVEPVLSVAQVDACWHLNLSP